MTIAVSQTITVKDFWGLTNEMLLSTHLNPLDFYHVLAEAHRDESKSQ